MDNRGAMPRTPSKRRRRAAVLLAVVAIALAVLKLPPVRLSVARTVAGAFGARQGAVVRMEGADWSLWPVGVSADAVAVQMDGMTVRVERMELAMATSRRWR